MAPRTRIEHRAAALVVALLVLLASPSVAHAEPARVSLVVTRGLGAEDCPDAPQLMGRIARLTRTNPFAADALSPPDTWIQVSLQREPTAYRAVIAARGRRNGTRAIEDVSPTCASLAEAVAVTLVMLLDPAPPSDATPARAVARTQPAPAASPPPEARWLVPGGEASIGASLGVLYHATPLLEAGVRLGLGGRFVLGGGGGFVLPDRAPADGGSVELGLSYAYLRGGIAVLESRTSRLSLLAGPLLGSLSGDGRGFETPGSRHLLWSAAELGVELGAPLGSRWSWFARLFALTPLTRQGFSFVRAGRTSEAFRTAPVGGTLTLGVNAAL